VEKSCSGLRVLRLVRGGITRIAAAMVNEANSGLRGGGGVDGAIHRAGGPVIMMELTPSAPGRTASSAVIPSAGRLPARHVFHSAGPIYGGGLGQEHAFEAYRQALAARMVT
jgi:O-acetyl-ADP-ribose deacetylase (regulator of RNase III)